MGKTSYQSGMLIIRIILLTQGKLSPNAFFKGLRNLPREGFLYAHDNGGNFNWPYRLQIPPLIPRLKEKNLQKVYYTFQKPSYFLNKFQSPF